MNAENRKTTHSKVISHVSFNSSAKAVLDSPSVFVDTGVREIAYIEKNQSKLSHFFFSPLLDSQKSRLNTKLHSTYATC